MRLMFRRFLSLFDKEFLKEKVWVVIRMLLIRFQENRKMVSDYREELTKDAEGEADLAEQIARLTAQIAKLKAGLGRPSPATDEQLSAAMKLRKSGSSLRVASDKSGASVSAIRTAEQKAKDRRGKTAATLARDRARRYRDAAKVARAELNGWKGMRASEGRKFERLSKSQ